MLNRMLLRGLLYLIGNRNVSVKFQNENIRNDSESGERDLSMSDIELIRFVICFKFVSPNSKPF